MPRGTGVILSVHHAMGHEIVVFTREAPGEADYEISIPYHQIVLPECRSREPASDERLEQLRRSVRETKCDLVIHHEYYARFLADDLRVLKEMGVPVLVQWHSCFCALNMVGYLDGAVAECLEAVREYAAGVLTLSRVDRTFFELLGVPAVHIPYSDPDMFDGVPVHDEGHKLLWTGRFYPSKRPVDALRILELVLEKVPDATLTMLGDGIEMPNVKSYLAEHPDLADHVELPGFVNDVRAYLADADVFLVTTQYEGFMHSLIEAKMAALPVVGYRMDYLDTTRAGTGYLTVDQGDCAAAAAEVVRLLLDPEERHRQGALARKDFEWFLGLDQRAFYEQAFQLAMSRQDRGTVEVTSPELVQTVMQVQQELLDMHAKDRCDKFAKQKEHLARRQEKLEARTALYLECKAKLEENRAKLKKSRTKLEKSRTKLESGKVKLKKIRKRLKKCEAGRLRAKKKLKKLKSSRAYRLGFLLLKPIRKVRRLWS